jgi:PAS domain S-box-containing protein
MSLRGKILTIFATAILVTAAFVVLVWLPDVKRQAEGNAVEFTRRHIASVADGLVPLLLENRLASLHETISALLDRNPDWISIALYDAAGNMLYPVVSLQKISADTNFVFVEVVQSRGEILGSLSAVVDIYPSLQLITEIESRLAYVLITIFLFTLTGVAVFIEFYVRRPARQLAQASNRLAGGDFDTELPKGRRDEIGTLVTSFQVMRDQIRADQQALRDANEELEERVSQRTAELTDANAALHTSEERFRDFAQAGFDRFWECDRELQITWRWQSGDSDRSLGDAEFIGKTYWDLYGLPPENASIAPLLEAMTNHVAFRDCVVEITPFEGCRRFRSYGGKPVFDESGKFKGYRGVTKDCSREVLLELESEQLERRFQSLIENSSNAIITSNIEGQLITVNRTFEQWFGVDREAALGTCLNELLPNIDTIDFAALDEELLERGEAFVREIELPFVDGGLRNILLTKFPIRDAVNEVNAIGSTFNDITEFRQAETQLRQAQKMEAVGQLTGGVAHDFNNLLTVVIGNLELLEGRARLVANKDLIGRAMTAALRGAELTQQLLSFSRKQTLAPRTINPARQIGGMIELTRRTIGEVIEIETDFQENCWHCRTDPAQLENAVLNLAINARDAMRDGGTLRVQVANILVDTRVQASAGEDFEVPPGEYVRISVADNGIGMSEQVAAHVFEPFFTTKDVGEGSGLGLSMVFGFIKQSGGYITLDTAPDEGTTVSLYLPRSAEVELEQPANSEADVDLHEEVSVLLVEDNEDVREMAVEMLERSGFRVIEAASGAEGLAALSHEPGIAMLLTDVVLAGGMSGPELARQVLVERPEMKIVYMSGYAPDDLDRSQGDMAGHPFITKPFRRQELARLMLEVLAGDGPEP